MKIGILQCGHIVGEVMQVFGDYAEMYQNLLSGNALDFDTYNVVDMEFPASVSDADAWLLSGSRHAAYDDMDFIAPLEDFIRDAYQKAVPMVGICFGHQIIAQALGGRVEKFGGGWALGPTSYQREGLGPISLNAWHQDQVVERPADAKVIASNAFCENAAFLYGDKVLTIQPHPEFTKEIMSVYLKARRGTPGLPDEVVDEANARLDTPVANSDIAAMIVDFLKQPRKAAHV